MADTIVAVSLILRRDELTTRCDSPHDLERSSSPDEEKQLQVEEIHEHVVMHLLPHCAKSILINSDRPSVLKAQAQPYVDALINPTIPQARSTHEWLLELGLFALGSDSSPPWSSAWRLALTPISVLEDEKEPPVSTRSDQPSKCEIEKCLEQIDAMLILATFGFTNPLRDILACDDTTYSQNQLDWALLAACEFSDGNCVALLLHHGARASKKSGTSYAQHLVATSKKLDVMKALLVAPDLDLEKRCDDGATAFHLAIANISNPPDVFYEANLDFRHPFSRESIDMAALLLSHGAAVDAIDLSRPKSNALYRSAGYNHKDMVEWLLRHDADVEVRCGGRLPMHAAAKCGSLACMMLLKKHLHIDIATTRTSKTTPDDYQPVQLRPGDEKTDLWRDYCEDGDQESVSTLTDEWLFEDGGCSGQSPLMLAARYGHVDAVRWLTSQGACCTMQDGLKRSVLEYALCSSSLLVIESILAETRALGTSYEWYLSDALSSVPRGCSATGSGTTSPLNEPEAVDCFERRISMLMEHGADLNHFHSVTKVTLLMSIAGNPKVPAVYTEKLVKLGARPDIINDRGRTAMHYAADMSCARSKGLLHLRFSKILALISLDLRRSFQVGPGQGDQRALGWLTHKDIQLRSALDWLKDRINLDMMEAVRDSRFRDELYVSIDSNPDNKWIPYDLRDYERVCQRTMLLLGQRPAPRGILSPMARRFFHSLARNPVESSLHTILKTSDRILWKLCQDGGKRLCHRCESGTWSETGAPLRFCAGCQKVCYCSKECQRCDWKMGHKRLCSIYATGTDDEHGEIEHNSSLYGVVDDIGRCPCSFCRVKRRIAKLAEGPSHDAYLFDAHWGHFLTDERRKFFLDRGPHLGDSEC